MLAKPLIASLSAVVLLSAGNAYPTVILSGGQTATDQQRTTVENIGRNVNIPGSRYVGIDPNTGQVIPLGNNLPANLPGTGGFDLGGSLNNLNNIFQGGSSLAPGLGQVSNGLGNLGNTFQNVLGAEGLDSFSKWLGDMGNGVESLLSGLGIGGAGGAAGAAGAGGAGAGGAGGGGGALVMDIGAIMQAVLQLFQMQQQTGLLGDQLGRLTDILNVNAEDLMFTQALTGNVGSVGSFFERNGQSLAQLDALSAHYGAPGGTGAPGGGLGGPSGASGGPNASGFLGSMSSGLSHVGQMFQEKAQSTYNIWDTAQDVWDAVGNFSEDPVGTGLDLLSMLFGNGQSRQLEDMTYEEMVRAGADMPGYISSQVNSQILGNAENDYQQLVAADQRRQMLQQQAASAQTLAEQAAVTTQVQLENARLTNEANAKTAQANQQSAAASEAQAAIQRQQAARNTANTLLRRASQ